MSGAKPPDTTPTGIPQASGTTRCAGLRGIPTRDSPSGRRQRYDLVSLRDQLKAALAKKSAIETKAHLSESIARIDEALKANIQRTSF